jgi:hypothetical protein
LSFLRGYLFIVAVSYASEKKPEHDVRDISGLRKKAAILEGMARLRTDLSSCRAAKLTEIKRPVKRKENIRSVRIAYNRFQLHFSQMH